MDMLSLDEFLRFGYLQEVNRRFFHPLGLALMVRVEIGADESRAVVVSLAGILDNRDDPEGIVFEFEDMDPEKAQRVQESWDEKAAVRQERLGFVVQPVSEGE